ncbi:MAG: hypothetical protein WDA05_04760 [Candidatus Methanomethylophilaceae archaeon]|jgi:hypothetical protein|nr:hypothetical protein [Candidatus Methanomethylophilaceae archaeon]MDD3128371.1 hypothetical protein [Candidatus Methanomethylophilaceae archaeon]MDD4119235.1 hypothetical protein [Candidatus Methanomethylophilaceae archaeon]MDD4453980.1 hypothetical protein [Candidatus Methanomethylophilaceae archaeon]
MGFFDKVDGKLSKVGSKAGEASDVESLKAKIKAEERNIDERTVDIGEFYWNAYASGRFVPDPASMESFKALEESLVKIEEYNKAIEDRKAAGIREREEIDAKVSRKEEERKTPPDAEEDS